MERELLLLGLLRQQDMHGYELHEFINGNMTSLIDLKKPTAYHLLDKMEQHGWLQSREEDDSNRPVRKVYEITEEGETVFQRLLRENLATYTQTIFTGNIGLAFLDDLPHDEALTLLRQRQSSLREQLVLYEDVPPHGGSMGLVIDHQLHHLRSEEAWLASLIKRTEEQTD